MKTIFATRPLVNLTTFRRFADMSVPYEPLSGPAIRQSRNLPPLRAMTLQPTGFPAIWKLGIAREAPVVGTLSVLRPEKALDVLVEAAALLRGELPELRVLIAGAGREEARLRELIEQRRLEDTVLLLGFQPNVRDVINAIDVAVFSSDREGSPLAVLESMAAGKAIVATGVGGIPALVQHEEHALIVPPRDPAALADATARALRDRALRDRLGRNAQERQRREFDIGMTLQSVQDLYEQLFAASRRGRREALVQAGRS